MAISKTTFSGRCFCGQVHWHSTGEILWTAICHCEDCRRAASADYVSFLGLPKETVTWSGPRTVYKSSEKVHRSFCSHCGTPMSFESAVFPDETHLLAVTLDHPETYRPSAHIYWSERLPWTNIGDALPKHEKGLQVAALAGKKLL